MLASSKSTRLVLELGSSPAIRLVAETDEVTRAVSVSWAFRTETSDPWETAGPVLAKELAEFQGWVAGALAMQAAVVSPSRTPRKAKKGKREMVVKNDAK